MIGKVSVRHTGVRLDGGHHAVGGSVDHHHQSVDEGELVGGELGSSRQSLDLGFTLTLTLTLAFHSLSISVGSGVIQAVADSSLGVWHEVLSGQLECLGKFVQSDESCQAHGHHDREEGEKHLDGKVWRKILSVWDGHVSVCLVSLRLIGDDTPGDAHTLCQSDYARNETTQPFSEEIRSEVLGWELRHERHEGNRGGAVHQREEEGDDEEGQAVRGPGHNCDCVPEDSQQDAGQDADGEDGVNDHTLFVRTRAQLVHESNQQRSQVGQLDDHRQVRGEVPALGERVDDERQLHPQAVHCHPGAQAEGTGQHVDEQRHAAAGSVGWTPDHRILPPLLWVEPTGREEPETLQ